MSRRRRRLLLAGALGGGATVANQPLIFGGDTLQNVAANGARPIASNGNYINITGIIDQSAATRTYAVADGRLYATNGTPEVDDDVEIDVNTDLGPITITIQSSGTIEIDGNSYNLANAYSCGTDGMAAIIALGDSTIDGKTIIARPEADIFGDQPGDSVTFTSGHVYVSGITIVGESETVPSYLRRATYRGTGPIRFRGLLHYRDTAVQDEDIGSSGLMTFWGGAPQLDFEGTDIYGGDAASQVYVYASGSGAVVTGNDVDLSAGNPDLSGLWIGDPLRLNNDAHNHSILAVNNTTKVITVADGGSPPAPPVQGAGNWTLGNAHLLQITHYISGAPEIKARRTRFHEHSRGVFGLFKSVDLAGFGDDRNHIYNASGDYIQLRLDGTETLLDLRGILFGAHWSATTDASAAHGDVCQILYEGSYTTNTVPLLMDGWEIFMKGGRNREVQLSVGANLPGGQKTLLSYQYIAALAQAANGLSLSPLDADSNVNCNSILYDQRATAGNPPRITSSTSDSVRAQYNITASITGSGLIEIGNVEFGTGTGQNDNADYAAQLIGADFDTENMADLADFRSRLAADPALWVGRVVRGAYGPYFDHDTGVSDAPWEETGFDGDVAYGDIADAEIGTAVTSSWITVSGASSTGVALRVSGGVNPTITVRDTDETTVVVSGYTDALATNGQQYRIEDTASLTPEDSETVTIEVGATTGEWTVATAASAVYVPYNFDGSTDWLEAASQTGLADGKKFTLGMGFEPTGGNGTDRKIFFIGTTATNSGAYRLLVSLLSNNLMQVQGRNTAGTSIFNETPAGTAFTAANGYREVLIAVDLSVPTFKIYVKTSGTWADVTGTAETLTDDTLDLAQAVYTVAAQYTNGSNKFTGDVSWVWFDDEYHDITDATARSKFASPGLLGPTGAGPFGVQPITCLYSTTDDAEFLVNKGSGGNWSIGS